jgi:SAM-dependent methyltransferase
LIWKLLRPVVRPVWSFIHSRDYVTYYDRDYYLYYGALLPPRELRARLGNSFLADGFYLESGIAEARRLQAKLGYTKTSSLVELGCGVGRLATGMISEFGDVPYLGIDANPVFTKWCQDNIERTRPSYHFVHLDVVNDLYNPSGTIDAERIRLPVDSGTTDIVYLWGVFTNMGPEHVKIYVTEISRIARDGGRVFLTAYVEDNVPDVSFIPKGYLPYECNQLLQCVRYSQRFLFSIFDENGLTIEEFRHHGGAFPNQSEIYLRKTPRAGVYYQMQ